MIGHDQECRTILHAGLARSLSFNAWIGTGTAQLLGMQICAHVVSAGGLSRAATNGQ
jgi:hypothetical protein